MVLTRVEPLADRTLGLLWIGDNLTCHTLEPPLEARDRRAVAIPAGRYPAQITYSRKLGAWLPLLIHVPGRSGIRIHAGNYPKDTIGCILPGDRGDGIVLNSRHWVSRIKRAMVEAQDRGEAVWFTIK